MRWFWPLWMMLWSHSAASADARLAIIIDDIGYNAALSERAARLPGDFTLSVLPFTPHGNDVASLAHRQGKELMLHVPMSNIGNLPLGAGGLSSGMEKDQLVRVLRQDLNSINHIKGINNHMGSRLTQEEEPMRWIMEELRTRGLYFVDSRTSAKTRALETAHNSQVPSVKRDVFLDDIQEKEAIMSELERALQLARQRGMAVAIGHPYPSTLQVLEGIQPLLQERRVKLVFASQLVNKTPKTDAPILDSATVQSEGYCAVPSSFLLNGADKNINLSDMMRFDLFDPFAIK